MADTSSDQTINSGDQLDPLSSIESVAPDLFDRHVGDEFRITVQQFETPQTHTHPRDTGNGSADVPAIIVRLKLVEVTRYPRLKEIEGGFDHRTREPFALLFEGPSEPQLMSCMHSLAHDQLGRGELLISPIQLAQKPTGDGHPDVRFYEVTFN